MKFLLSLCFLAAIAAVHGQGLFPAFGFYPFPVPFPFGYGFPSEDVYAASLGGAKVGLYGKSHPFGYGFPGFFGGSSDIAAASLGDAPVGLYEKEKYY